MARRTDLVLAVAALFFVLTWLTVSLRVYVRAVMLKTWGWDDWTMVATLLVFTVYLSFQVVAAHFGSGRHRWELSDHDARIALIFWYLCELLYVISNCLLKISLSIFYLRVAIQRWHIWVIKILAVGAVFFGICYFFMIVLQCIPVSEFWNNHPMSEKCFSKQITFSISYTFGWLNIIADWGFGILPFFIVWQLQMNVRTKLLVAGILAFAAIGSTGTIVRMSYIKSIGNGPDFLWATIDIAIWSTVEPGIGITAASMATLRPLLQTCLWRMGLASAPSSAQRHPTDRSSRTARRARRDRNRQGHRNFELADFVPSQEGSTSTTVSGPETLERTHKGWTGAARSWYGTPDEERTVETGGISKSVVLKQETEGPPRLPQFRDSLGNSFMRGSYFSNRNLV